MPVVGDKLELLVPKEESKPRGPQAEQPLVATKIVHETPDKVFHDPQTKIRKEPRKIEREIKLKSSLRGETHKAKGTARTLNYQPQVRKQKHLEVAPEFRMTDKEKEDLKQRVFKMRSRLGV